MLLLGRLCLCNVLIILRRYRFLCLLICWAYA